MAFFSAIGYNYFVCAIRQKEEKFLRIFSKKDGTKVLLHPSNLCPPHKPKKHKTKGINQT